MRVRRKMERRDCWRIVLKRWSLWAVRALTKRRSILKTVFGYRLCSRLSYIWDQVVGIWEIIYKGLG